MKFQLNDRVKKFLPDFTGDGRNDVTIRHLLTHVSGLPDQLATMYSCMNLRAAHTSRSAFGRPCRTRLCAQHDADR
jgi:CubicO group peptidase (beta-lactamase class C family)